MLTETPSKACALCMGEGYYYICVLTGECDMEDACWRDCDCWALGPWSEENVWHGHR